MTIEGRMRQLGGVGERKTATYYLPESTRTAIDLVADRFGINRSQALTQMVAELMANDPLFASVEKTPNNNQ